MRTSSISRCLVADISWKSIWRHAEAVISAYRIFSFVWTLASIPQIIGSHSISEMIEIGKLKDCIGLSVMLDIKVENGRKTRRGVRLYGKISPNPSKSELLP